MALAHGRKALLALALLALAAARPARAQGNDDTDLDDATVVDLAGLTDSAPPLPARPPASVAAIQKNCMGEGLRFFLRRAAPRAATFVERPAPQSAPA